MLEEIKRILKPDGIIYIKVPNGLFNLLKLKMAKFTNRLDCYDIFDSYEHVLHFSQATLKVMLEKNGFKIIAMKIARPVQLPAWHKYVGFYYQYPSPWILDPLQSTLRTMFYLLSLIEFKLRLNRIGYFAPNIVAIARKK
jgi:SAM-dependent methyltransferase